MPELTNFLQTFGNLSLEYFWFPLIVWTVIAIPVTLFLRKLESIPSVYQYHSRVALLFALPLGIVGSYLAGIIGKSTETAVASTKFIVVQNPITATASTEGVSQTVSYSNPLVWIGILSTVVLLGTLIFLSRMIINAYSLKKIDNELNFIPISQVQNLHVSNADYSIFKGTFIAFSDDVNVPFTYGWITTRIVIPEDLINAPQKCSMAVQHELMHIKHRDFILNGFLMFIKTLFWFHPLTHYLHATSQEYREITCDSEVLAENKFSKKSYASLLVQLAERDYQNSRLAMSMAVNPSSLKKRIQIMSEHSISDTRFRSSFLLTFLTAGLLVVTISCSDISDNGITDSEFEQTQSQMMNAPNLPDRSQPLYVINGEEWDQNEEAIQKLSRIKSKYIKDITVLKDQKAKDAYGEAGTNGVVEIQFADGIDKETVFADLKDEAPMPPPTPSESKEGDFFVAVEDMPELKGGLADLQREITYPEEAREAGIQGKVIIQFIVNEEGEVENPQVIQGIGGGADEEALRVVRMAEFEPGMQDGEPVRVQYSLPITFQLASEE